jgi:hypothetical protein
MNIFHYDLVLFGCGRRMTNPYSYRIYGGVKRKFNPWLFLGLLIGFFTLMITAIALDYQSSFYAFINPTFSSYLDVVSLLTFFIGMNFLFILVLSHAGAIQNHA